MCVCANVWMNVYSTRFVFSAEKEEDRDDWLDACQAIYKKEEINEDDGLLNLSCVLLCSCVFNYYTLCF